MSRRTALRPAFGPARITASISLLNLTEPSPPRPMTNPGRDVFMMTRTDFSLRSISTEVTYAPRKRFLRKRLIAASTQTLWRYFAGDFENQRDFQSRMMPRRCAYGCTVCVILFCLACSLGGGGFCCCDCFFLYSLLGGNLLCWLRCLWSFCGKSEFEKYSAHRLAERSRASAAKWSCAAHDRAFVDCDGLYKKILDGITGRARVGDSRIQKFA